MHVAQQSKELPKAAIFFGLSANLRKDQKIAGSASSYMEWVHQQCLGEPQP